MVRLTKDQIKSYQENGFVKISGIFSDKELEVILKEYERIFELKNNAGMEAAWLGDDMRKAAKEKPYSVSLTA